MMMGILVQNKFLRYINSVVCKKPRGKCYKNTRRLVLWLRTHMILVPLRQFGLEHARLDAASAILQGLSATALLHEDRKQATRMEERSEPVRRHLVATLARITINWRSYNRL